MKITEYFAGYYLCTAKKNKIKVVNLMNRRCVKYSELIENDGVITFKILKTDYNKNPQIAELCESTAEYGFFPFFKKKLKRPGLLLGILIFAVTLFISCLFVWDVELTTGGGEDAERIIRVLEENGLRRGALKLGIDKRRLENIVMLLCPDVSYIAVNTVGNSVSVITDERIIKESKDKSAPCDLIASEDGYIIRYETYKGQTVCEAKTSVKRGDILISGTVETKHHGIEQVHSEGRVFAVVKRSYLVQTAATHKEKYYTGNEYKTVNVKMFSTDFNVKNDPRPENCDVFEEKSRLSVFGIIELPVFIKTTLYREYSLAAEERNEEQIKCELNRLSAEQFLIITDGCEVLSSAETVYEKNGVWYLYCDVWCVSDIAAEAPLRQRNVENGK